jgi:hypothetical protein
MNEQTHRRAQVLIQSAASITPDERGWLQTHLAACPDCCAFTSMHKELSASLPLAYAAAPLSKAEVSDRLERIQVRVGGHAKLAGLFHLSRGLAFAALALVFLLVMLAVVPGLLPDPAPLPLTDATLTPRPVTATPSLTPEPDATVAPTALPNEIPVLPPASASDTIHPAAVLVAWENSLEQVDLNGRAFAEIPNIRGVNYQVEAENGQLHPAGALPDEPTYLPLAAFFSDNNGQGIELRQNGQRFQQIPVADLNPRFRVAPGRPALAYSINNWVSMTSELFAAPMSSLPARSPLLTVDFSDGSYPYHALALDAWENGRPHGIWVTRQSIDIGGFSIPPNKGLWYFDVNNALETEILSMDYSPQGISPDRSWIAYTGGGQVVLQSLQQRRQSSFDMLPDTNWNAGYAVFSPDNNHAAWVEVSGEYYTTLNVRHMLRIATVDGEMLAEFDHEAIVLAVGLSPILAQPYGWVQSTGWLDNSRLLISVILDTPHLLVFDLRSGSLSLFVNGPARFVDFVYRDGPVTLAEPAPAPDDPGIAPSPYQSISQSGGSIRGIVMQGDTAFVVMGPRLAAIDLSNPAAPRLLGASPPFQGMVNALVPHPVDPYTMIAAAGKRLIMLDISDPTNIVPLHALELPGAITSLALDPNHQILYASGETTSRPSRSRYYVAAVRLEPGGPLELLDQISVDHHVTSLALGQGVLYLGSDLTSVGVYAMQFDQPGQLSAPKGLIASTPQEYLAAYHLHATRDRLFVGSYESLYAYDILDPLKPVELWKVPSLMTGDIAFDGERVHLYGWMPAGTFLPFQRTAAMPEPYSGPALGISSSDVALLRGRLIVAQYQLGVFEAQPEGESTLLGTYRSPMDSLLGAVSDNEYAYLVAEEMLGTASDFTLHVLRLPDLFPLSQTTIPNPDRWSGADWFRGITLEGDRLYVAWTV